MALRARILAVLALLVGVNATFVLAILWGFLVLVPTVVTAVVVGDPGVLSDVTRLPVSPVTYLGLVVLFLAAQLYYGYRRVLSGTEPDDGGASPAVEDVVRRLAMTADVPSPQARVVEHATPVCYTVGRFTDSTVVVTTGLLEELDTDELAAVLAHEVAHVANRDVTLMTITTLFLEIATRAYNTVRLVPRAFGGLGDLSVYERVALRWFLPLSVAVYVLVAPLLLVFPWVAAWATRTLAHEREFAADEAAARMTGDPLALATALATLSERTPEPERDLRTARTGALCVVPTRPVSGAAAETIPEPAEPADDREERLSGWVEGRTDGPVTGTHPPVAERVVRLRELMVDREEGR